MRRLSVFGLAGVVLTLAVAFGWYLQNSALVHDWFRSFGQQPHAADEVIVRQRSSTPLPGFDGAVQVRVGDIQRGQTVDVAIIGPDAVNLGNKQNAQIGDRIYFAHHGNSYCVEVAQLKDRAGTGDWARLKLIPLKAGSTNPG